MEEESTKTSSLEDDVKDLTEHVGDFLETYVKLTTVRLAQKTISAVASMVNITLLAILFFFVIFFAGFGLAWWLGSVVNSRAGGFFIVAGVYLIVMFICVALGKKTILPMLRNLVTRFIYD